MLSPVDALLGPRIGTFNGLRLIYDKNLLIATGRWEWAHVRSRGRALRRNKKHRQNVYQIMRPDPQIYITFGTTAIGHPAMLRHLERKAADPNYVVPPYDEADYQPVVAGPPPQTDPRKWSPRP